MRRASEKEPVGHQRVDVGVKVQVLAEGVEGEDDGGQRERSGRSLRVPAFALGMRRRGLVPSALRTPCAPPWPFPKPRARTE